MEKESIALSGMAELEPRKASAAAQSTNTQLQGVVMQKLYV